MLPVLDRHNKRDQTAHVRQQHPPACGLTGALSTTKLLHKLIPNWPKRFSQGGMSLKGVYVEF